MSILSCLDQADEDAEKSQVQERLNLRIGCQSRKLSSFFQRKIRIFSNKKICVYFSFICLEKFY